MENSWGVDLWDRLDAIIDHCTMSSNLIDKCHKCLSECQQISVKAATKQKRLLEKLQAEFSDPFHTEFSLTTTLLSVINNFVSLYNIRSTFADSALKASDEYLKKTHSEVKKGHLKWISEKKKMEDDLYKERKKYELSLKRYREKCNGLMVANDTYKKTEENTTMSRSQVDLTLNSLYVRRSDFDQAKQEYAVQLRDLNRTQQSHFHRGVPNWGKRGLQLYEQRLSLLGQFANQMSRLTQEYGSKTQYCVTRFVDVRTGLSADKDCKLLIQKFKTGDVPPGELQFIDLDLRASPVKSSNQKPIQPEDDQTSSEDNSLSGQPRQASSSSSSASNSSGPSTSNSRPPVTPANQTVRHSSSQSSFNLSSNHDTRSETASRYTVNNVKMRNTGTKFINPEARLSIHKSGGIFRSHAPWRTSVSYNNNSTKENASIYQQKRPRGRPGAAAVAAASSGGTQTGVSTHHSRRQSGQASHRRSRSVSDMLTTILRSSFGLGGADRTTARYESSHSPALPTKKGSSDNSSSPSEFDSDSVGSGGGGGDVRKADHRHKHELAGEPTIVSTPADAVAEFNPGSARKMSAPDYATTTINNSSDRPPSPDYDNHQSTVDCVDGPEVDLSHYVGSCVSEHDFDSGDTTNNYLSFSAGDQFYIFRSSDEYEKSGWIYVEKTDQSCRGFAPASYMNIRSFEDPEAIV